MTRRKRGESRAPAQTINPYARAKTQKGPSEYIQRKALELSRSVENYHDYARQINAIGSTPRKQYTMEEVKELFSLPQTMGAPQGVREQFNLAFDAAGGFTGVFNTLNSHTHD